MALYRFGVTTTGEFKKSTGPTLAPVGLRVALIALHHCQHRSLDRLGQLGPSGDDLGEDIEVIFALRSLT